MYKLVVLISLFNHSTKCFDQGRRLTDVVLAFAGEHETLRKGFIVEGGDDTEIVAASTQSPV